jgi:hypothetical protein
MNRATHPIVPLLALLLTATALSGEAIAQQNIVDGEVTLVSEQKRLGLVRVGGCSGTLINRFWVLTADHCVSDTLGGESLPFEHVPVSAAWSRRVVTPTRYVRYLPTHGVDVALVFLGAGDLGPAEAQPLRRGQLLTGARVTKHGRGLHAFATRAGTPPVDVPARTDGRYRHAVFNVSATNDTTYTLPTNSAGQTGNAGDSGGPDIVTGDDGAALGISGVSSTCTKSGCLSGKNCDNDFTWVTSIRHCKSAPILSIRGHIQVAALDGIEPCRHVPAACTVSEITHLLVLP